MLALLALLMSIHGDEPVTRHYVDGDPTVAGALPCVINPGDVIVRRDTRQVYHYTADGAVAPGLPAGGDGVAQGEPVNFVVIKGVAA